MYACVSMCRAKASLFVGSIIWECGIAGELPFLDS